MLTKIQHDYSKKEKKGIHWIQVFSHKRGWLEEAWKGPRDYEEVLTWCYLSCV